MSDYTVLVTILKAFETNDVMTDLTQDHTEPHTIEWSKILPRVKAIIGRPEYFGFLYDTDQGYRIFFFEMFDDWVRAARYEVNIHARSGADITDEDVRCFWDYTTCYEDADDIAQIQALARELYGFNYALSDAFARRYRGEMYNCWLKC